MVYVNSLLLLLDNFTTLGGIIDFIIYFIVGCLKFLLPQKIGIV